MAMVQLTAGLTGELAQHWVDVLTANGIQAGFTGEALWVDERQLEAAKALFDDPFGGEAEPSPEPAPERPPVTLGPDERTELLARTGDLLAAQRLAEVLQEAGLYASVSMGNTLSTFGIDPGLSATITIAQRQRAEALKVLEAFARQNTNVFAGPMNIDPAEVVDALLLALQGRVRIG